MNTKSLMAVALSMTVTLCLISIMWFYMINAYVASSVSKPNGRKAAAVSVMAKSEPLKSDISNVHENDAPVIEDVQPEPKRYGELLHRQINAWSSDLYEKVRCNFYDNTVAEAASKAVELNSYLINAYSRVYPIVTDDSPGLYIPILMYHNFVEDESEANDMSVEIGKFKQDLELLIESGYVTLHFQDLKNYVQNGKALPEKCILITMDDGYLSNYTLAYPVLKELNAKATIFIIGSSVGVWDYDENGGFFPHFDMEQAREMISSGLIDIQSHSFDLHDNTYGGADRDGLTRNVDEPPAKYIDTLRLDDAKMQGLFLEELKKRATVFAYPFGHADRFSEEVLSNLGYSATVVSGRDGFSFISHGFKRSLFALNRYSVKNDMPSADIVRIIEEAAQRQPE